MKTLSPFRYPGSKEKYLRPILSAIPAGLPVVDVFAGGGSVSLGLLSRGMAGTQVTINDLDPYIACFWQALTKEATYRKLRQLVIDYKPSVDSFLQMREWRLTEPRPCNAQTAFIALAVNRLAFNGIATSGPIGGTSQSSKYTVGCRWNGRNILQSIDHVRTMFESNYITVTSKDFRYYLNQEDAFLYLDPPYFDAGNSLYVQQFSLADHKELAQGLSRRSNWVLSYDGAPEVWAIYRDFADIRCLPAKTMIRRAVREELLIVPKRKTIQRRAENPIGLAQHGEIGNGRSRVDIINSKTKGGTDPEYLTARIARDHPDILDRMKAGEYASVRRAAIDAGIVKEPTRLERLQKLWTKATDDERAQFLEWMGEEK
jgi:DNA adenine methylase